METGFTREVFAKRFREWMDERGLTNRRVAARLGVDERQVSRWRTGETGIAIDKLSQIALEFDLSLDWLVLGRPERQTLMAEDELANALWNRAVEVMAEWDIPARLAERALAPPEDLLEGALSEFRLLATQVGDVRVVGRGVKTTEALRLLMEDSLNALASQALRYRGYRNIWESLEAQSKGERSQGWPTSDSALDRFADSFDGNED